MADVKKQNNILQEKVQGLTHDTEEGDIRKGELENQLKSHQKVGKRAYPYIYAIDVYEVFFPCLYIVKAHYSITWQ